jgi:REP element-mobilizing transposase RayT
MPSRYYRRTFIRGYYYHIYNRGANKEIVFKNKEDYVTFLKILEYYLIFPNGKPLSFNSKVPNLSEETSTSIFCAFCLMPNHFHLILKQESDPTIKNCVTNLMRRLIITYSMYFQKEYEYSGTLFQGKYKNVLVNSDSQLLQLSKYIHRNPIEILGSEPLESYSYSSYRYYAKKEKCPNWLHMEDLLDFFTKTGTKNTYKKFVEEESSYIENDFIKSVILES